MDDEDRRKELRKETNRRYYEKKKQKDGEQATRERERTNKRKWRERRKEEQNEEELRNRKDQKREIANEKQTEFAYFRCVSGDAVKNIRELAGKSSAYSPPVLMATLHNLRAIGDVQLDQMMKPYYFVHITKWTFLVKAGNLLRSLPLSSRLSRKARVPKFKKYRWEKPRRSKGGKKLSERAHIRLYLAKMRQVMKSNPKHAKNAKAIRTLMMRRIKKLRYYEQRKIYKRRGYLETSEAMASFLAAVEKAGPDALIQEILARVQRIIAIRNKVLPIIENGIKDEVKRLVNQVTAGVHHPKRTSEGEKALRTVGRMSYHIIKDRRDDSAVPLASFYPALYRKFVKLPPLEPDITDVVKDVMEELVSRVEEMISVQQPDGQDAYNMDDEAHDLSPADPEDLPILKELGDELLDQDADLAEVAGPLGAYAISRVMHAKECTDHCVKMTVQDATQIKKAVNRLAEDISAGKYEAMEQFDSNVLPRIQEFSPCYSGIRSLLSRLRGVKACVKAWLEVDEWTKSGESIFHDSMINAEWSWLPQKVRRIVQAEFSGCRKEVLGEAATKGKFGEHINSFRKEMAAAEDVVCDICHRYTMKNQMSMSTSYRVCVFLKR